MKSKKLKKVSESRWKIAQDSEKEYWDEYSLDSLKREEIERHKKKTFLLEKELSSCIEISSKTKILQIGCGPEDIINYFPKGELYAIDPLAEFYKKKFKLDYKNVHFIEARGENIPFADKFFDVIIIANVLDHTESPQKVLAEIKRVLKDDGVLHFENLFYQKKFLILAKIWGFLKDTFTNKIFNIHHPFMFSLNNLYELISTDFIQIKEYKSREIGSYNTFEELKEQKKKESKLIPRLLARFGLYGAINYITICRKR